MDIEKLISDFLKKKGKDYLTVNAVKDGIGAAARRELGITDKTSASDALKKLKPYLDGELQAFSGSKSTYIGFRLSPREIILKKINEKPGVTSKSLGSGGIPMLKKEFLSNLNALLESGAVICTLGEDYSARLKVSERTVEAGATTAPPARSADGSPGAVPTADDRAAFKAAYNEVGKGRGFVRIHRIRETLGWPRERFDRVLAGLRANLAVALHVGDPSTLKEEEIRNSFMDESGALFITMTWKG